MTCQYCFEYDLSNDFRAVKVFIGRPASDLGRCSSVIIHCSAIQHQQVPILTKFQLPTRGAVILQQALHRSPQDTFVHGTNTQMSLNMMPTPLRIFKPVTAWLFETLPLTHLLLSLYCTIWLPSFAKLERIAVEYSKNTRRSTHGAHENGNMGGRHGPGATNPSRSPP